MVDIGRLVKPGSSAPARGTYICTLPGCTGSFVASMRGAPLPPAHHPEALWKLTEIGPGSAPARGRKKGAPGASAPSAVPPGTPARSTSLAAPAGPPVPLSSPKLEVAPDASRAPSPSSRPPATH